MCHLKSQKSEIGPQVCLLSDLATHGPLICPKLTLPLTRDSERLTFSYSFQELLLVELSNLLSNAAQSENARKAAAIQLKNYLTSKDEGVKVQYQQRWLTFDGNNKLGIKNNVSLPLNCPAMRLVISFLTFSYPTLFTS